MRYGSLGLLFVASVGAVPAIGQPTGPEVVIAACRDAPASRFVEHALKAIE